MVVAGTGFAATFFLHELLSRSRPDLRVIVLERGDFQEHAALIENRFNAPTSDTFYRPSPSSEKMWTFSVGFGGGSNCWWGNTPRMLPADFEIRSRFGQGVDWPFGYDELEPYYAQAEALMEISGLESPHAPMSAATSPPDDGRCIAGEGVAWIARAHADSAGKPEHQKTPAMLCQRRV